MKVPSMGSYVRSLGDWTDRQEAMAGLVVAMVVGSFMSILIRWSHAPSTTKVFYRVLFAALIVAPVAVVRYRDDLRSLSGRDLLTVAAAGAALTANLLAFFESLDWTSVAASVTLAQTQTIFVAVGAYVLLGERIDRATVIGIVVAFVGVILMSVGGAVSAAVFVGERPAYGNGLALFAGVAFAAYLLTGRSVRGRVHLFPYIAIVYTASAVVAFVYALAVGAPIFAPYPPREWLLFLAMAVVSGGVTQPMINFSLRYLESSLVSVTLLGFPVVSALYALVLLAELPGPVTVVGGAMVLGGIYITTRP